LVQRSLLMQHIRQENRFRQFYPSEGELLKDDGFLERVRVEFLNERGEPVIEAEGWYVRISADWKDRPVAEVTGPRKTWLESAASLPRRNHFPDAANARVASK
jgi:hypothetical protein